MYQLFDHDDHSHQSRKQLLNQVRQFLVYDEWSFHEVEGEFALALSFQGFNGSWHCVASIAEDAETFLFYSLLSQPVPDHRKTDISEFITRANFGLLQGCFELDFDDGELRYRISAHVTRASLTHELIEPIVYKNITAVDYYLPGIHAVLSGEKTAKQAIEDLVEVDTNLD